MTAAAAPPFGRPLLGNGWDALAGLRPAEPPRVSVVVTHFDQPRQLERTLCALRRQRHPSDRLEIIVADDGSREPPEVPDGVRLVVQEDLGFRAAAARNLGAAHATGDVLCFLDADTAPEPDYVSRMSRLPALAPEVVTVGRRRHADWRGTDPCAPVETSGPAHALPDPGWLADAYRDSGDLLRADQRSYRFVLSAVLACSRWFFAETGGFDDSFTAYGGEDWEWAHRAWTTGAALAHVPDAVAWHDGPDWAARTPTQARERKNVESLALAERMPVAGARGRALLGAGADVAIDVGVELTPAALFVLADSLLGALPHAVVVVGDAVSAALPADPRVRRHGTDRHRGSGPGDAPVRLDVTRPFAVLGGTGAASLRAAMDDLASGRVDIARLVDDAEHEVAVATSRRARVRRQRWGRNALLREVEIRLADAVVLGAHPDVEAWVGGWAGPAHLAPATE